MNCKKWKAPNGHCYTGASMRWNSLPKEIKCSINTDGLKILLKVHLFYSFKNKNTTYI